jgi:hypothetical protein
MAIKVLDQIANHPEFFGYSAEKIESETADGKYALFAQHPGEASFLIFEVTPLIVIFRARFVTEVKPTSQLENFQNSRS